MDAIVMERFGFLWSPSGDVERCVSLEDIECAVGMPRSPEGQAEAFGDEVIIWVEDGSPAEVESWTRVWQ